MPPAEGTLLRAAPPTLRCVPPSSAGSGEEAVDLAAAAGLQLDPWQADALVDALGERPDGTWAASDVAVEVPRQNGKGSIIEARELAGLFLLGERMIIHTAHEVKTSGEAFLRAEQLFTNVDWLRKEVKRVNRSHGEKGVELLSGQRLRFIARSRSSGRGFTCDCLILDEAFQIADTAMAALRPTLSARPNRQIWFLSSSVDRLTHPHGAVLGRLRARAQSNDPGRLVYLGWSAMERDGWEALAEKDPHAETDRERLRRDPEMWARANPAYPHRIDAEAILGELGSMSPRDFDVERLGIGDWPADGDGWEVITEREWASTLDGGSTLGDLLAMAVDVTPDQQHASIAAAGPAVGGGLHAELVEHRPGTGWLPDRLAELVARHRPAAVALDAAGPAGTLLVPLAERGLDVVQVTSREYAQACGRLRALVRDGQVRRLDQLPLTAAVAGARSRPLGDAWGWARRSTSIDISPLVAVTLALWAVEARATPPPATAPSTPERAVSGNPWRGGGRLKL